MVELRNINVEVNLDDVLDGLRNATTLETIVDSWQDAQEVKEALDSMISSTDFDEILSSLQSNYTLKEVTEKWPDTGKDADRVPASIVNMSSKEIIQYLDEIGVSFQDIAYNWPKVEVVGIDNYPVSRLRDGLEAAANDEDTNLGTIAEEIGKVFPLQDIVVHWPDNKQKEDAIIRMLANIIRR